MTRVAPRPEETDFALVLDIRCGSVDPSPDAAEGSGRCQLLAGHDGVHAAMYCRGGERTVRSWHGGDPDTVADRDSGWESLAWVRGLPFPAWTQLN